MGLDELTSSGGGIEVIETQTVSSAVAAVDFTSGFLSKYQGFRLRMFGLVFDTDGVDLQLQTSNDGGSSWITGYNWAVQYVSDTTHASNNGGTGSAAVISSNNAGHLIGTASGEIVMGTVDVSSLLDGSAPTLFQSHLSYNDEGGNATQVSGSAVRGASEANDAIRVAPSSGNITSGIIQLVGIV